MRILLLFQCERHHSRGLHLSLWISAERGNRVRGAYFTYEPRLHPYAIYHEYLWRFFSPTFMGLSVQSEFICIQVASSRMCWTLSVYLFDSPFSDKGEHKRFFSNACGIFDIWYLSFAVNDGYCQLSIVIYFYGQPHQDQIVDDSVNEQIAVVHKAIRDEYSKRAAVEWLVNGIIRWFQQTTYLLPRFEWIWNDLDILLHFEIQMG